MRISKMLRSQRARALFAVLGLTAGIAAGAPAQAAVRVIGGLAGGCPFNCVDVFEVKCAHPDTHAIRLTSSDDDGAFTILVSTMIGLTPKSIANHFVPGTNVGGFATFLTRPGTSQGPMKANVLISTRNFNDVSLYTLNPVCLDAAGNVLPDPRIKTLQVGSH